MWKPTTLIIIYSPTIINIKELDKLSINKRSSYTHINTNPSYGVRKMPYIGSPNQNCCEQII